MGWRFNSVRFPGVMGATTPFRTDAGQSAGRFVGFAGQKARKLST